MVRGAESSRGIVAVFAKPSIPGMVKTRLAAAIGPHAAARLSRAFFEDTWTSLQPLPGVRLVLAGTAPELGAYGLEAGELWAQGDGDLGARMERVALRALAEAPWFLAVGTDSPGRPESGIMEARDALTRHDAVLGPADDGGYYLLGLRRTEPGLLAGLPWSAPDTLAATRARLESRGYSVASTAQWFDVDEPKDLLRLKEALARGAVTARRTAAVIAALHL
jgi:uncharacterized protein